MSEIRFKTDAEQARWAFARAPEVMLARLREGAMKGADVVTREARRTADGGFVDLYGALRNSIMTFTARGLPDGTVGAESRATVKYAAYVEDGTGPAAGHRPYYPNPDVLLQVLRSSPRSRGYKWAKKGSKKRGGQELELWLRSRAWAMAIFAKGTKPYPFMRPAAERSDAAVRAVMSEYVGRGIAEVFGVTG